MRVLLFGLLMFSPCLWGMAHDQQTWVQLTGQGAFKEDSPWGWFAEYQPRYSEVQSRTYETLVRPGLTYRTQEWGTFTLGHMQRWDHKQRNIEDRPWQQWLYRWNARVWAFTFRWRQEQRNIHAEPEVSHRSRWLLRAEHLPVQWRGVMPFVACELLYNWNSVSARLPFGLHQSRTFIGATYTASPLLSVDLAYLAVITNRRIPNDDSTWNTLWLSANFRF